MTIGDYSCPKCGEIPHPNRYKMSDDYAANNYAYKMIGGKLKLPPEIMKLISCCGSIFVAPFHSTPEEYIGAIKQSIMFYAPMTEWLRDLMKNEENSQQMDK